MPRGVQQGVPLVGQRTVHHLCQQGVQRLPDGGAAQAQGRQVPTVHRQVAEGEACLLFQQGVQYLLRAVNVRQTIAVVGMLGQIVRPLYRQQLPERALPSWWTARAMAFSVRGMSRSCHCTSVTT